MNFPVIVFTTALIAIFIPAFAVLVVYSLNLYYLILIAVWRRMQGVQVSNASEPVPDAELPFVTVQIPLYNERYVSRRIIDAVAKLDWPADKLQIQILDDSTDETRQIVAEGVRAWQERGVAVEQINRPERKGYKAGALSYALPQAKGEYVAIFDADFIPSADFLRQTVPILARDPKAAFIQVRWEHLNREESWLTRIQAIALDGHFAIEQFGRSQGGYAFNFNGTAGVWRRAAIDDAGGWKSNTLTEDLDLSYRAWLKGWHGLYRLDVAAPAELPPTMTAFRRQQSRWAQGCIECSWILLPSVWKTQRSLMAKLQASAHLLGYLTVAFMVLLMVWYPLMLVVANYVPEMRGLFALANTLGPITLAPTIFYIVGQLLVRRFEVKMFLSVLIYQLVGAGMAMNTIRAALRAMLQRGGEFLRTPKWGNSSPRSSAYRLKADLGVLIDILWGIFALLVAIIAMNFGHIFLAVYGLMSWLGSWSVGLWTLWPDLRALMRSNRQVTVDSPSGV